MSIKLLSKKKKGFMLADVLLAMFIIITALTAMLAAIMPVIYLEAYKRDHIIATNLAQEGIEMVRNMRDNNWKNGRSAFDATGFPNGNKKLCGDYFSGLSACGSGNSDLHNTGGVYNTTGAGAVKFTRYIDINVAGENRSILSKVSWNGHSVQLTSTLTNWGDK